jgi:hypothetical protein
MFKGFPWWDQGLHNPSRDNTDLDGEVEKSKKI